MSDNNMVRDFADVPQKFIKDGSQVRRNSFDVLDYSGDWASNWSVSGWKLIAISVSLFSTQISIGIINSPGTFSSSTDARSPRSRVNTAPSFR